MTCDPATIPTLPRLLSPPRLSPYLIACEMDRAKALRLYTWNIEVSAAFWGELHALEVVVRNSLDQQLRHRYERAEWWSAPGIRLTPTMAEQLRLARLDASKVAARQRRPVVAGDVVAALSLGFWTGLLGAGRTPRRAAPFHDTAHRQYETQFWQPFVHRAFPHYSGPRTALHRELDRQRKLRNRIAHHEPVFGRALNGDHQAHLRLAGYVRSDAYRYIESHSRVPQVLLRRGECVAGGGSRF